MAMHIKTSGLPSSRQLRFRADIEGLRGLAVLIVVAFHCGLPFFKGGFVGVDVFFALSGYLITRLLIDEFSATSRLALTQFYARRARRLLPASATMLVVTLLAGSTVLAPHEMQFAARAARACALYLSNFFFAINAADYFAPNVENNPLLHTWSLAVEEQFYLFWPLLMMFGLRISHSRTFLTLLLSGLTIASLFACQYYTAHDETFAFYGLPTRAWEFGLGGLATLLPRMTSSLPRMMWIAIGWGGAGSILASAVLVSPGSNFPGLIALVPVLGTAATLVSCDNAPNHGVYDVLKIPALQFFGKYSYSWYLWHWPMLVFATALLPAIGMSGKVFAALLALCVAAAAHGLIENPIRFSGYLKKRTTLTLSLASLLTVVSIATSLMALRQAKSAADDARMQKVLAAVDDISELPRTECVSLADSVEVKSCDFGNPASRVHWVLFGDSHAIQWFNALRRVADSHEWRLTTLVKSGCPAADVNPLRKIHGLSSTCAEWRRAAFTEIAKIRPTLVIAASASVYLKSRGNGPSSSVLSLDEWTEATKRTMEYFNYERIPVIALRDTPTPAFDVPTCLARSLGLPWHRRDACSMQSASALNSDLFEAEMHAAEGLAYIAFLDMSEALCSGDSCSTVRGDEPLYRDDNHLTGSFAASLAPAIEAKLLPIANSLHKSVLVRSTHTAVVEEPRTGCPADNDPRPNQPIASNISRSPLL